MALDKGAKHLNPHSKAKYDPDTLVPQYPQRGPLNDVLLTQLEPLRSHGSSSHHHPGAKSYRKDEAAEHQDSSHWRPQMPQQPLPSGEADTSTHRSHQSRMGWMLRGKPGIKTNPAKREGYILRRERSPQAPQADPSGRTWPVVLGAEDPGQELGGGDSSGANHGTFMPLLFLKKNWSPRDTVLGAFLTFFFSFCY